jgi:hypothetical protein
LVLIETPRRDARVAEMLRDPDRYFAEASARAWTAAQADVEADLAERARHRLNHHADPTDHLPAWLPTLAEPRPRG